MTVTSNVSLQPFNTFGIQASCRYFTEINSINDLQELQKEPAFMQPLKLILGGGSNLLLTKDVDGIVIKNNLKGISIVSQTEDYVLVKCAAGEVWHNFVMWTIGQNLGGLENLSLIPGCTGASPMQNIGAYGVEIKDTFHELEAIDMKTGELVRFDNNACKFGYRESVFKRDYKDRYFIASVTFKLSKKPVYHIEYGAIKQQLDAMGITELSLRAISDAVIHIRRSKLPDPAVIGNAGSFFKNPEVSAEKYNSLKESFPNLVAYPLENGSYKLAAGWLIEQSGLKGYRAGDAGVHTLQALVLVNYGKASGKDIYNLSTHVLQTVSQKFGVELEREVNII
ncbi:MAG: UDP-N-acetylmuramate dehydrogenase [Bacteroidetes bacterium]|nr:UDP-N-acetylmuramate dehydrogenase [Bacteroidota bacterium]